MAEHSYDSRTPRGHNAGHLWTLANFSSLWRPSHTGMIFDAHFKAVSGKGHKMHRRHTRKILPFISTFYEE